MGLLLNTHMLPCQIAPIAHNKKTCVCESRRCYILFEWLLIGLSEYNAGSIRRHGVEQIQKTEKSKTPRGGFEEVKEVCDGFHAAACE